MQECRVQELQSSVLHDITTLFLLAAFNQEGSEAAEVNVFLTNLGCTHLFHNSSTTAETVTASTPVSRAICFTISALVMFCKFLSDKDKQTSELKKAHRQSDDYTNRFIVLPQNGAS